jgi:TRAP-type C4-dicarboxylate transport system substrate-binding protein
LQILQQTNGRVKISVFLNNQLGGDDTDRLSEEYTGKIGT